MQSRLFLAQVYRNMHHRHGASRIKLGGDLEVEPAENHADAGPLNSTEHVAECPNAQQYGKELAGSGYCRCHD